MGFNSFGFYSILRKTSLVLLSLFLVLEILVAQSDKNSDDVFYQYMALVEQQNCDKLDDKLLSTKVNNDRLLEHLAQMVVYANCLLKKKKIVESEEVYNLHIKTATDHGYYKIARHGLEDLSSLITFYKSDQIVKHGQRKVTFDSLYSSKEQLFTSLGSLLFTYNYINDIDESIKMADRIIESADTDNFLCDGYFGKANALKETKPAVADSLFKKIIEISASLDSFKRSTYHKEYGNFLLSQGKRVAAIDYLILGLDLTPNASNYDLSRTGSLNNLSQLFYGLKQFDRAREYIDQAIEICQRNQYKSRNAVTAMVNAQLLRKEGKIEEALSEISNSKKYYNDRNDLKGLLSNLSLEKDIAMFQNNRSRAFQINESIDSILSLDLSFEVPLQVYGTKSTFAIKYGSPSDKKSALNEYYAAAVRENDPVGKHQALIGLYELYREEGRLKDAMDHLEEYTKISTEMFETEQMLTVNKMESEYNRKGQDLKIASLDQENKLKAQTVSFQRKAIAGSGVGLAMFALLSFSLFRLYKKVNSQKAVIEKALTEKDILLREIHHRVKNNLQLVSSLLTIQSRDIEDEQALEALSVGKSRVKSMSLIHQDLYQKDKLTGINVKNYLEKLSSELFNTYKVSEDQIDLHLDIEDIDLDVDTIVPLGLIINELITNALKYAFPDDRSGNIYIEFKMEGKAMKLMVKDDGVGMANSISKSTSFGNTLVKALTKQLDGKITLTEGIGTELVLLFKDYKIAA